MKKVAYISICFFIFCSCLNKENSIVNKENSSIEGRFVITQTTSENIRVDKDTIELSKIYGKWDGLIWIRNEEEWKCLRPIDSFNEYIFKSDSTYEFLIFKADSTLLNRQHGFYFYDPPSVLTFVDSITFVNAAIGDTYLVDVIQVHLLNDSILRFSSYFDPEPGDDWKIIECVK